MHRIFISDLHLNDVREPQYLTLAGLLAAERTRADEIYILGDLCEVWVGDDDDSDLARGLQALLADTARHAAVYVMHGNRDFLLGEAFAAAAGCRLLPDPHPLGESGEAVTLEVGGHLQVGE